MSDCTVTHHRRPRGVSTYLPTTLCDLTAMRGGFNVCQRLLARESKTRDSSASSHQRPLGSQRSVEKKGPQSPGRGRVATRQLLASVA